MIDAHAHAQEEDLPQINQHDGVFVASANESDWPLLIQLKSNRVRIGFGIHPWCVNSNQLPIERLKDLKRQLLEAPSAFLGETGLDKSPRWKKNFPIQLQFFQAQIRLAMELSRPIVVHSVKAHNETLNALKQYKGKPYLHGFIGSVEIMQSYQNAFFGINQRTLKSTKTRQAIAHMSPTSILVESDSRPNAADLQKTIAEVAKIKRWSFKFTKSICTHNANTWLEISQ